MDSRKNNEMETMPVNKQLQKEDFRFAPLPDRKKAPPPEGWPTNNVTWDKIKSTNYAVITGYGGLIVLDADCKQGNALMELLPKTFTVETSQKSPDFRGKHAYYICHEIKNKILLFEHSVPDGTEPIHLGEIQSKGQYVVGPGSTHPTGLVYDVAVDVPIATITEKQLMGVVSPFVKEEPTGNRTATMKEESDPICKKVKEKVPLSDVMKKYNMDTSKSPAKCPWHKCSNDCFSWSDVSGLWHCFDTECMRSGNIFHLVMQMESCDFITAKKKLRNMCDKTVTELNKTQSFFDGREFVSKRAGDLIQSKTVFKTLKGSHDMFRYKDGIYTKDGEEWIKKECKNILGDKFNVRRANEVVGYIQAGTYIEADEVNNDWINLENGLLNPLTKEFKDHTPDVFSITRIPITYNPKADCPLFKEKLAEKTDKRTIDVIQEMFGYCFLPGQKYEVAFIFYGPPRTMKSTTLFMLESVLGKQNIQSFSLQTLTEKSFALAYLYGCPANICADLSALELKNTAMFMKVVGGDPVTADKKHQHPFTWFPSTKLIFSCNVIPATPNKSLAYYRRWIPLQFTKQTDKTDVIPDMREQLIEELPGILNWSLRGLDRIENNNGFSYWLDDRGIKDLYERSSDTISSFIYRMVDMENDIGIVKKRVMYKEYEKYCKTLRLPPENQIKFGRVFREVTGCGTCKKDDIPSYKGVNLQSIPPGQSKLT